MFSYAFYKVVHIISALAICYSIAFISGFSSGQKGTPSSKFFAIVHGLGLLALFVAGFGLLARLGLVSGWPSWVVIKLILWVILALLFSVAKRFSWGRPLVFALALGTMGLATFLAAFKPEIF